MSLRRQIGKGHGIIMAHMVVVFERLAIVLMVDMTRVRKAH